MTNIIFKPHCRKCGVELKEFIYKSQKDLETGCGSYGTKCIKQSFLEPGFCPNCGDRFYGYVVPVANDMSVHYKYSDYKPYEEDEK